MVADTLLFVCRIVVEVVVTRGGRDGLDGGDEGGVVGGIALQQGRVRSSINKVWNPLVELYCFRALSANQLRKKC